MVVHKKKVMIVDDNELICSLLADAFALEDCEVVCAGSGNEAARRLRTEKVDAVLSDIRMADGSGLDLLDQLKLNSSFRTPVFLMTAFADTDPETVRAKGGQMIIQKPFDVFAIVKNVLKSS